ncbi:Protein of unknown function (DUF2958) [Larkinella arboricola]|uniref:DUF2958 family protein n=2 Tax=Larkinella arboricola TaxID=643671 RepID=A0A327WFL3_LARAB|nr:DUF2958 domain-containing protein [Larkinella arboricola]RAJ89916.1 Protein of unknown function (DUF2958) [Larkinella arboricola]
MKLFTKEQLTKLLNNGSSANRGKDHKPVVKLFTPDAGCTWLLTEIDPEETDLAFGLCDLGLGFPELGYVSITELTTVRGRFGLPVERDLHFEGKYPISVYADAARQKERIVTEDQRLLQIIATATKKQ